MDEYNLASLRDCLSTKFCPSFVANVLTLDEPRILEDAFNLMADVDDLPTREFTWILIRGEYEQFFAVSSGDVVTGHREKRSLLC